MPHSPSSTLGFGKSLEAASSQKEGLCRPLPGEFIRKEITLKTGTLSCLRLLGKKPSFQDLLDRSNQGKLYTWMYSKREAGRDRNGERGNNKERKEERKTKEKTKKTKLN